METRLADDPYLAPGDLSGATCHGQHHRALAAAERSRPKDRTGTRAAAAQSPAADSPAGQSARSPTGRMVLSGGSGGWGGLGEVRATRT